MQSLYPELMLHFSFFQGKVFPKLKKRCPQGSSDSVSDKEEEEATDYVFRIIFPNSQSDFGKRLNNSIRQALEPINVSPLWYSYFGCQLLERDNREKGPSRIHQGIFLSFPFFCPFMCTIHHKHSFGFTELFWLITVTVTHTSHLSLGTVLLARSLSLNSRRLWPHKRQTLVMPMRHCSCPGGPPSSPEPSCNSPCHISFMCSCICLMRQLAGLCLLLWPLRLQAIT